MTKYRDEILRLRAEGKTYNEIQAELGCSKGTIAYHCGEGQEQKYKESSKRARDKRYKKFYALKSKPCMDCGGEYIPTAMHFDHIGTDKEYHIAGMLCQNSWEAIEKEIAKCELVCGNCHALRTAKRAFELDKISDALRPYYVDFVEKHMVGLRDTKGP